MQNLSAPPIVLASSSPYRRELLQRLVDDFQAVSPDRDETPQDGEAPGKLVRRLARSKAEAVAERYRDALIVGADQAAMLDARVLGKPGNHPNAVEQLLQSSGKAVSFLTAACVLDPVTQQLHEHTDVTEVRFRRIDRELADAYLRHDEPYDCAGSFRVEGAGCVLFESVTTDDPTALIGLPMIWLAGVLRELGYLQP
jgi:septum formation protein